MIIPNETYSNSEQHKNIQDNEYPDITWNSKIEKDVKEIGEKSKGYKIMHVKESRVMSQRHRLLMYSGIVLGPIAGLLSGIGAILNPDAPVKFPIASACVAFISGIVIAITKYGKFEEKSSHHKIAASKYTGIESNVRRQLVLCKTDRINAAKYLEYVGGNFDDLFLASPLISKNIYEEYSKIANSNGIVIPDEYGLTIKVDEMYQKKKFNEMKNVSSINVNNTSISSEFQKEQLTKKPDTKSNIKRFISGDENVGCNKEIKRSGTFNLLPELNKYSDARMEYEMQRMMGLTK